MYSLQFMPSTEKTKLIFSKTLKQIPDILNIIRYRQPRGFAEPGFKIFALL